MKLSHATCLATVMLSFTLGALPDSAGAQDIEYHEIGLFFGVNDTDTPPDLLAEDSIGLLVSKGPIGPVPNYTLASDPAFGDWAGANLVIGVADAVHVRKGERLSAGIVATRYSGPLPWGMWLATGNAPYNTILDQRVVRVAIVSGVVKPNQAGPYWFVVVSGVFLR